MAISTSADIKAAALWPQGDIRDPLGVWGFRLGVIGDASGGSIKVQGSVPPGLAAAYVYTCYSVNFSQLTGTIATDICGIRLLTGWPDVDPITGVQAYSTHRTISVSGDVDMTPPITGMVDNPITPNDRFLLLFDPRPSTGGLPIVEIEFAGNTNLATYSFEGYGYFWDRSVLNAPGGPRHPGSN